jgi:Transposase DDE domain
MKAGVVAGRAVPREAGATYVFDKGYTDHRWWFAIRAAGAFFVTRRKRNADCREIGVEIATGDGIAADRRVKLGYYRPHGGAPKNPLFDVVLREFTIARPDKDEPLYLLTNDFNRPAAEIARLYKERWQIELLFKWLKQNLKIRRFLGRSENAGHANRPRTDRLHAAAHPTSDRRPLVHRPHRAPAYPPQTRPRAQHPAAQTPELASAQPANLLGFPINPIRRKIPDSSARKPGKREQKLPVFHLDLDTCPASQSTPPSVSPPPGRVSPALQGFGRGKRNFEYAGICCNPEKGPQHKPGEANEVGPRERIFKRGAALSVPLRPQVIGIKRPVRVDQDHR